MEAIDMLLSDRLETLNIKKLKGFDNIYRARVQSIRIIYRKKGNDPEILGVYRRGEDTYKNF